MRLWVGYAGADRITGELVTHGLRLAGHLVPTASTWSATLAEIRQADAVLALVSRAALGSQRWTAQWQYALTLGRPALPIVLEAGAPAIGGAPPVDFAAADAMAAFRLIGAVAALPAALPLPQPLPFEPPEPLSAESPPYAAAASAPSAQPVSPAQQGPAGVAPASQRPPGAYAPPPQPTAGGFATTAAEPARGGYGQAAQLAQRSPAGPVDAPGLAPRDIHNVVFRKPPFGHRGYDEDDVDALLDEAERTLKELLDRVAHPGKPASGRALTADDLHNVVFKRPPRGRRGYVEDDVDDFLDRIAATFRSLDAELARRRS